MIELDVKIGAGDLYDYMLWHTYNSPSGLFGSVVGALLVIVSLSQRHWPMLAGGLVLLLYLPWMLFIRSRKQALNNRAFREPFHYLMDERGLTISQGGTTDTVLWDDMVKAVSTGRSIFLYISRVNATILPKSQMGDKRADVMEIISTHMPPEKVKIKG